MLKISHVYYYLQNKELQILKHFNEFRHLLDVPNMEVDKAEYSGAKLQLREAAICLNSDINY